METRTYLRVLRRRYGLLMTELGTAAGLSNQYLSRAELGYIQATERLEKQIGFAVEAVITRREKELQSLKQDFEIYRGRLLQPAEGMEHDE